MANIFLTRADLSAEDRLTAGWEYVLDAVPGLGQAFVDHVCSRAKLPPSQFSGAIKHPRGTAENRPDFLVKCKHYDILCEHKLSAKLGNQQLERYLTLLSEPRWKLALVAGQRIEVSAAVRAAHGYIFPTEVGAPSHFLWQDVHRVVRRFRPRIARDFAEYLEHLGLATFSWPGMGNPFTDPAAAEALKSLFDAITPSVRRPGAQCRTRSGSLIYEIRRPFQPIHLLNVGPLQTVADFDPTIWGPVMAAWAWVRGPAGRSKPVLPTVYGHLEGSTPCILTSTEFGQYPYDAEVFIERYYYVPLREILVRSRSLSLQRLEAFCQAVLNHLRGVGRVIAHDDASQVSPRK